MKLLGFKAWEQFHILGAPKNENYWKLYFYCSICSTNYQYLAVCVCVSADKFRTNTTAKGHCSCLAAVKYRIETRSQIQRKTWWMGPNAVTDYNLTLRRLQNRLQRIYHGQPCARVGLNPMPETTDYILQSGTQDLVSSSIINSVLYLYFPF
jgi:hypothetical protein